MPSHWTELPGQGTTFFATTVFVSIVAVVCFAGRTYTSFNYIKKFRLDYWLSLVTLIICAVSQIAFWVAVTFGLGSHEEDLGHLDIVAALRTSWIQQVSGLVAIVTGKISIIEFLDKIRGHHQGRPWFLYIVGISIVLVNVVVTILPFFQCTPVEKLWDEEAPGDCSLRGLGQAYAYFQGSHSAITDVILALYPIHLIWGVQMSKRLKIGLCCLMGFGLLAAVCSTIKTIELRNLTQTKDKTFFIAQLAFVTMIEAWIVLIVGCIPSLRPLMKAIVKRLWAPLPRSPPSILTRSTQTKMTNMENSQFRRSQITQDTMERYKAWGWIGDMPLTIDLTPTSLYCVKCARLQVGVRREIMMRFLGMETAQLLKQRTSLYILMQEQLVRFENVSQYPKWWFESD